jgi:hypothetical protein
MPPWIIYSTPFDRSMSGPLHVLREWLREGVEIDDSTPGFLRVGDTQLSLSSQTEYHQKRGSGAPYTLDSIWALYYYTQIQTSNWTDYVRTCKENNVFPCIFQDKVEIIDWLLGTRATVSGIVEEPVDSTPAPTTAAPAPAAPALAFAETRYAEPDTQKRPEASMELTIATTAPVERGGTVEYELIRSLDSVLVCPYDFSEMANRRIVLESTDRTKKQAVGTDEQAKRLHGEQDDSFFGSNRPVLARKFQNPIIMVSMSAKTRVNNTNIEKFLAEGEWVPPGVDQGKESFQIVHRHSLTASPTRYDIVANEKLMKPDDWNFVVAVFLIGAKWQVKSYVPSDPLALLSKVLGIYVGWDNETLPVDIAKWKVKEFKINKTTRHGDYQVVQNIWHDIEDATAALKKRNQ